MTDKLRKIMTDRLYQLLGIMPDERLLNHLYNEIVSKKNVTDIVTITDEVLITEYLALEDFLSW